MYNLLIIDDEEKIREGIANLFPWNNIGFEIVGDYSNGEDALEYIAALPIRWMWSSPISACRLWMVSACPPF